ncbi:sensor histidine kinase [uncultured Amnibacterium sp.]|uniref:sensor histidine kinase n=1 Tax=uncultured Amnibacterium sp. TaxID=1631851 RepID=UPI0035C9724E
MRAIRTVAACGAVGNVLTLATTPIVFSAAATASSSPWTLQLTALGTTAAALALPITLLTADVVLTGALVTVDRFSTESGPLALIPLQDGLYAVLFSAVFAGLAVGALRAGRAVDDAAAAAVSTTHDAQDERIRSDERARVNGLVHDHVLTTLLVAARGPSTSAAVDAVEALEQLRRLTEPGEEQQSLPDTVLLDRLRSLLSTIAPTARAVIDGTPSSPLPPKVIDALVGATGEALRNSRRHGGAGASIELHVSRGPDVLEIAVIDDGVGFDEHAVPANRLGIAASIVGRLRSVDGAADVYSHRGRGTAVRLRWPAQ